MWSLRAGERPHSRYRIPAGAGKTIAMGLVAPAVDAASGRLILLAPSARAAKVLSGDLQRRAHTLHAWLHQRSQAAAGTVGTDFHLRSGDVVLVVEAGNGRHPPAR